MQKMLLSGFWFSSSHIVDIIHVQSTDHCIYETLSMYKVSLLMSCLWELCMSWFWSSICLLVIILSVVVDWLVMLVLILKATTSCGWMLCEGFTLSVDTETECRRYRPGFINTFSSLFRWLKRHVLVVGLHILV